MVVRFISYRINKWGVDMKMYLKNSSLFAVFLSHILFITSVQAAVLEEVVVTAQKREQSLQEVPVSVSVLSDETLDRRVITDTRSLAQAAPSINFQDGFAPIATNFSIRGIGSYLISASIQPSVSLVVDGVPLARTGEFITELSDIERIEVLRGPQGTLFGRNSTGGAINVVTKRPGDEFEGSVSVSATDDEEQIYRASLSGPLTENVGGSVVAYYTDRDGHIKNVYPGGKDFGKNEAVGVRGKLDIDFSDSVNVLFTADYNDTDHGFNPGVTSNVDNVFGAARLAFLGADAAGNLDPALSQRVLDDGLLVNINDNNSSDVYLESWGVSADVTWEISDTLTLKSISAYREWDGGADMDVDTGPGQVSNAGIVPVGFIHVTTDVNPEINPNDHNTEHTIEYFSQELRLEGTHEKFNWIAGFYYQNFEQTSTLDLEFYFPFGAGPLVGTPFLSVQQTDNAAGTDSYAGFVDLTYHLTDTIDIFGGFRWTHEELDVVLDNVDYTSIDAFGANTFDPANNFISVDLTNPAVFVTVPTNDGGASGSTSDSGGDWSGRIGIAWQATEDINVYASASRGFVGSGIDYTRAGRLDRAFLDPTTAENYEIGIKTQLADNFQLNASIYMMDVTDLQTEVLVVGGGSVLTLPINAGDMDIHGLEADAIWAVTDYVRLTAGFAYTDAEIENLLQPCYTGQTAAEGCTLPNNQTDAAGNDSPNTPEFKYNVSLDWDVPLADLPFDGYANITYTWQDDVFFNLNNDPLTVQEDYGLLDFTIGVVDKDGLYELSFFGKNVTDEYYVGAANDGTGFAGRVFNRVPRGSQAYFGGRVKINF